MDSGKDSTSNNSNTKRTGYLSWEDYFMAVAFLSAQRSKDPSTQVGACIVDDEKKIVSIGYNGFPRGCSDDEYPWGKWNIQPLDNKYPYVCHAELNAILNTSSKNVKGCEIYITLFPCNECAKLIIQSGISKVIYFKMPLTVDWRYDAAEKMFKSAKIPYTKHISKTKRVCIEFR